jgi:hypothetical protein
VREKKMLVKKPLEKFIYDTASQISSQQFRRNDEERGQEVMENVVEARRRSLI